MSAKSTQKLPPEAKGARLTALPPIKQRLRQAHRLIFFIQHSQQGNPASIPKTIHRVQQICSAHNIDHDVDPDAAGQSQRFGRPVWRGAVVDRVRRAELARGLQFGVGGGGCDDCGAGCGGDLEIHSRSDRFRNGRDGQKTHLNGITTNPPSPLRQHRPALQKPNPVPLLIPIAKRIPRSNTGGEKRARLHQTHPPRRIHHITLVNAHEPLQRPIPLSASEGLLKDVVARRAGQPGVGMQDHAVACFPMRLGAGEFDHSGTVGAGD
jgi:hypothetical protein